MKNYSLTIHQIGGSVTYLNITRENAFLLIRKANASGYAWQFNKGKK
jgi:hypothetical protein